MDNHDELVVFRSCVKHLLVGTSNTAHETASVPPADYDAGQVVRIRSPGAITELQPFGLDNVRVWIPDRAFGVTIV